MTLIFSVNVVAKFTLIGISCKNFGKREFSLICTPIPNCDTDLQVQGYSANTPQLTFSQTMVLGSEFKFDIVHVYFDP